MLVSIIVPVYNSEKTLELCIKSLISQTYKNIEIIIIDDGSQDKSEKIYKKYSKLDKRIIYKKIKNHGASYARNIGISISHGEYLCFVDSDDEVSANFCEVLLKNLISSNCDLSCCGYIETKNDCPKNVIEQDKKIFSEEKYLAILTKYQGFLCNKMFKKSIIIKNNIQLNENIKMCEDLLFNFLYLDKCKNIVCTNQILYMYKISNDSLSRNLTNNWFDILKVYNIIYKKLDNYNAITQKRIMYNLLMALFEAKVRCSLMKLNFGNVISLFQIDYKEIFQKYYKKLLKAREFSLNEKLKLFTCYRLYILARYIKIWKMR